VIGRIWHGYTTPEHADAYEAMLKPELLPGISKVKGYRGSYLLRRAVGVRAIPSSLTVPFWYGAGEDYEIPCTSGQSRVREGNHSVERLRRLDTRRREKFT
jgi:hypothetical protein